MLRSRLWPARPVTLLIACAACHRQPAVVHEAEPVPVTIDQSVAELSPQETAALAPRVARIAVMPDSISIAPGETYSYAQLRVVAIDSAGSSLGRLRVYDASLEPGAAQLAGARQLRGVYPGRSELWIRFPQALWSGGRSSLPAVSVHVIVRAAATGETPAPSPEGR